MKFYRLSGAHFMIVLVPYINSLNVSWIIKCQFLRNMAPLTYNDLYNSKLGSYPRKRARPHTLWSREGG